MPQPHFLIVTPSYNQAHFIEQTLDSVLAQKDDFTVSLVVMDGGSTDGTVEILKKYGAKINWASAKDNGQTDAINKGLKKFATEAQSDSDHDLIFAYLNSDDYYLPDTFATVAQAFAAQPAKNWLVGDVIIVNEQGKEIQKLIRWYKQWWRTLLAWPVLLFLNPIPQPATFIRWRAVEETGPFNDQLHYVMDYEYWLRLYQQYGRPQLLNRPLAAFRIHGQSKGGSQFEQQFAEELQVAKAFTLNPVLLKLHQLHSALVASIYRWLKP